MAIKASELILNPDGSIYHLNLKPEQLANTILTVGDPDRVDKITRFFDQVECKVRKREFHTQTGTFKGKRISVVSTGIGTDNIDIVFNELDALVNIDFHTREVKQKLTSLEIIRIGTSGSLQADIPIDSFLISSAAIGFDSLWYYYKHNAEQNPEFTQNLERYLQLHPKKSKPYFVQADAHLLKLFSDRDTYRGITATNVGFYGPQGRVLRAQPQDEDLVNRLANFNFEHKVVTNMEMETSGIYAMASILGHRALSTNAIIANRATGEFSRDPIRTTEKLILHVLQKLKEQGDSSKAH